MSIAVVGSPPYAGSQLEVHHRRDASQQGLLNHPNALRTNPRYSGETMRLVDYAGQDTAGNLAALPPGTLEETLMSIAVVGSPPYAEILNDPRVEAPGSGGRKNGQGTHAAGAIPAMIYGTSPGQLGALPSGTLDAPPQPTTPAPVTTWQGCYSDGWQDLIVPEAFAHPAKFARGLIHRIYRHLLERGYVRQGDMVLDPFGGVGLGALDALTYGLRYVGVELEPRFVALAQQNLDLWRQRYGFTGATVVQGDSRRLREVLAGAEVGAVVGSPPYSTDALGHSRGEAGKSREATGLYTQGYTQGAIGETAYGTTPGQLGAMPPGTVGAVVGSPPYSASNQDYREGWAWIVSAGGRQKSTEVSGQATYGSTHGQLGAMPPGTVGAVVGSPPYAESINSERNGIDWSKTHHGSVERKHGHNPHSAHASGVMAYGVTEGQLGAMPAGTVQAVVGSPPYAAALNGTTNQDAGDRAHRQAIGRNPDAPGSGYPRHYGQTDGQLGAMPPGTVVSSPPYAGAGEVLGTHNGIDWSKAKEGGKVATPARQASGEGYGTAPGQLGNDDPCTFWAASAQIMAELAALLPPGAVCAWVLKAYVSKGKIVPFPQQWQALCEAHGFVLVEEIHASLVEHHGTQEGLFGESSVVQTERKSFFRRLAEKKGSPRIDYETVLILRKAGDTGGVCVVSSPPFGAVEPVHDTVFFQQHRESMGRNPSAVGGTPGHYGSTPGNLGTMPVGMCVVGSPPWQDQQALAPGTEPLLASVAQRYGNNRQRLDCPAQHGYGTTPGNLGTMPVEKTP